MAWMSSHPRNGTLALHGVDVVPSPPPHRAASPSLGQRVWVAGRPVGHRDDRLAVVGVARTQSALSGGQVGGFSSDSAAEHYGAKPLFGSNWFRRYGRLHMTLDACFLIG